MTESSKSEAAQPTWLQRARQVFLDMAVIVVIGLWLSICVLSTGALIGHLWFILFR